MIDINNGSNKSLKIHSLFTALTGTPLRIESVQQKKSKLSKKSSNYKDKAGQNITANKAYFQC